MAGKRCLAGWFVMLVFSCILLLAGLTLFNNYQSAGRVPGLIPEATSTPLLREESPGRFWRGFKDSFRLPLFRREREETVLKGVNLGGLDFGGLSRLAAGKALAGLAANLETRQVVLLASGKVWPFTLRELGFALDADSALETVFAVGRQGSFPERWRQRRSVQHEGLQLGLPWVLDQDRARLNLQPLTAALSQQPRDASLEVEEGNRVVIRPSLNGAELDLEVLLADLTAMAGPGGVLAMPPPGILSPGRLPPLELKLLVRPVQPRLESAEVEGWGIASPLASFSTHFSLAMRSRSTNITRAAGSLRGRFLAPGEVFSFNNQVGPRELGTGYLEAPIIVGERFENGVGGGVCQVSSTLYNAALLAGLQIVERSRHSLAVTYALPGLDATVVYGYTDLKFANNTGSHLLLWTTVDERGGTLTAQIFGPPAARRQVTILRQVEEVFSPPLEKREVISLAPGETRRVQQGRQGYRVTVHRRLTDPDGQRCEEFVSRDTYRPLPEILEVGVF